MASDPGYSPFDLSSDPAEFGLIGDVVPTKFGKMYVARRAVRGGGEATLFLHGVGARWTTWTPLLRAGGGLAGCDPVLVDLPGFGESENRLGHLDAPTVAAELGQVVAGLGYDRVRLVGHSMGGLLALDMAAGSDLAITALHLAAGSGFAILNAVNHRLVSLVRAPLPTSLFWIQYAVGRSGLATRSVRALHRRHLLAPLLWPLIAHPRRFPAGALTALTTELAPASFRQAAANIAGYDAAARWARLTVPVYATFGAGDRFVTDTDRRTLARIYPPAHSTVIRDAAHFLHIERPHEVLAAWQLT